MPLPDLKVYDPSQSLAKGLQVRQMGIENQRADKRLGLAEQQFALAGREADVREMSLGARLKEIEMAEDKAAKESLVQELETDEVYNAQISNLVAGMDFDNPEQYQEKLGEGLDLIGAKAFDFYKRYYGDDQRASQKTQEIQKLALAEWGDPETAKEKLIGAGALKAPEKEEKYKAASTPGKIKQDVANGLLTPEEGKEAIEQLAKDEENLPKYTNKAYIAAQKHNIPPEKVSSGTLTAKEAEVILKEIGTQDFLMYLLGLSSENNTPTYNPETGKIE